VKTNHAAIAASATINRAMKPARKVRQWRGFVRLSAGSFGPVFVSHPLELLPSGSPTTPAAISIGHCRRSRRNEKLAAYDEILSAYLGPFGAGGVWPVIVCAGEKPACHAGGRGFEPRLSAARRQRSAKPCTPFQFWSWADRDQRPAWSGDGIVRKECSCGAQGNGGGARRAGRAVGGHRAVRLT
jgi:hypothetical protein